MAKILLADDHPLFLAALRDAVERAGIEVLGTATGGAELLELAERQDELDAVLLDLAMPGVDGFACLARLRELRPDVALIVVSGSQDEDDVRRAVDLGAVCFVGKAAHPEDVAGALRIILHESVQFAPMAPRTNGNRPQVAELTPSAEALELLTEREREILRLVSDGRSNAEVAAQLWVTEQTVKFHLSNTYRKIGVSNRTGASRWAQRHGLA